MREDDDDCDALHLRERTTSLVFFIKRKIPNEKKITQIKKQQTNKNNFLFLLSLALSSFFQKNTHDELSFASSHSFAKRKSKRKNQNSAFLKP